MSIIRAYNQKNTTVLVNGVPLVGLADGDSVKVTPAGGEVERTEGTDGPGLNQATNQGGDIEVELREDSPSIGYLDGLRLMQEQTAVPLPAVSVMTGVLAIETLSFVMLARRGELATGGKKMGKRMWKFIGANLNYTPSAV